MTEWGPWIAHDGGSCPLPGSAVVNVLSETDCGHMESVLLAADCLGWDWSLYGTRIPDGRRISRLIRYRVRRPSALTLLERIAADPQPIPGEHVPA